MKSTSLILSFVLGLAGHAHASIENAKPYARVEQGDYVITWEVGQGPIQLDSVSVFDFGALTFLETCDFSGDTRRITLKTGQETDIGLDGITLICPIQTGQDPENLVLNFNSVVNGEPTPSFSFYYPDDFNAIEHIDPDNVSPDDWITSTYIEFGFYRPELLASPPTYRFAETLSTSPQPDPAEWSDDKLREEASQGNADAQYLLGKNLLEADREKSAYYWLHRATLNNSTNAALLYFLDFESKYSTANRSPRDIVAAKAGCNMASQLLAIQSGDYEFLRSQVYIDLALAPDFLYLSAEAFEQDYLNWRTRLKAVEDELPNTVAAHFARTVIESLTDSGHFPTLTTSEQEQLRQRDAYQQWSQYIASLDRESDFLGCFVPVSLLESCETSTHCQ